nr:hypothetical protein [uncultured Oscillibacter sp.]
MQKDLFNAPITDETNHTNWKAGVKRKHACLPNLCGGSDTNGKELI